MADALTGAPEMPEPVAHAAGDWMRAITETELALIPNGERRDRCRAMYRVALVRLGDAIAYGQAMAEHARRVALEEAAKLCDEDQRTFMIRSEKTAGQKSDMAFGRAREADALAGLIRAAAQQKDDA